MRNYGAPVCVKGKGATFFTYLCTVQKSFVLLNIKLEDGLIEEIIFFPQLEEYIFVSNLSWFRFIYLVEQRSSYCSFALEN